MAQVSVPAGAASSPGAGRAYGLPAADAVDDWRELLLPFAGRLWLVPPSSCGRAVKGALRRVAGPGRTQPLPTVDVWLHYGLHFRLVGAGADGTGHLPVPGQALPSGGARDFDFFPLRRDEPDGTRHFSVHIDSAPKHLRGAVTGDDPWVVEVSVQPSTAEAVTFVAGSEADAQQWERQLLMRAAPLVDVWRQAPVAAARASPLAASSSAAAVPPRGVGALLRAVDDALSSTLPTGVVGVITAATRDDVFNLATSDGGLAGRAVGALCTAIRVCVAVHQMPLKAERLLADVERLAVELRQGLLPKVVYLAERQAEGAAALGEVSADVDALVGRLLHVALSWGARACEQVPLGGSSTVSSLETEVAAILTSVGALQAELCSDLSWETKLEGDREGDLWRSKEQARVKSCRESVTPPLKRERVVVDWDDADAPWCRLSDMIMAHANVSAARAAARIACVVGMGGAGKTTTCEVVVAQAQEEGSRFEDGVFWIELGQDADETKVTKGMLAVATAVSNEVVTAESLAMAVDKLRNVLAGKACLIVVDECCNVMPAYQFERALREASGCCLLLSTSHDHIASVAARNCRVTVGVMAEQRGRDVLLAHASPQPLPQNEEEEAHLAKLLQATGGLALGLAVLGSLVRTVGWEGAVEQLDRAFEARRRPRDSQRESLWACFQASYNNFDVGRTRHELLPKLYKALCVVEKQVWLPLSALSALWDVSEGDAAAYARRFGDSSLATVRPQVVGGQESLVLGLHDLLVDWVRSRLVTSTERQRHHEALVEQYASRLERRPLAAEGSTSDRYCRPWWELEDEYAKRTLCRHLLSGGASLQREAVALLFDWWWIEWHVGQGMQSVADYRSDCRRTGVALLRRVSAVVDEAVVASSVSGVPVSQQAAFELAERLSVFSSYNVRHADHRRRLVRDARQFLGRPSIVLLRKGALLTSEEVSTFGDRGYVPSCSCTLRDARGRHLRVSGWFDGTLRVWDVERGEPVAVLNGHTSWVHCVCVVEVGAGAGGGGAEGTVQRVVSGSVDNTLHVWDLSPGGSFGPMSRVHLPGSPGQLVPVTGHPSLLFVVCDGRVTVLVDLSDDGPPRPVASPAGPTCVVFPATDRLVVGSRNGRLYWGSLLL